MPAKEFKDRLIKCLPKHRGEYTIKGSLLTIKVGVVEQVILITPCGYKVHCYNSENGKENLNNIMFNMPDNAIKLCLNDTIQCLLPRASL